MTWPMTVKRKAKHTGHVERWPAGTTGRNVIAWATDRLTDGLTLFFAGYEDHDDARMMEHIKSLRAVVTRIDQFRRTKVREWAANGLLKSTPAKEEK